MNVAWLAAIGGLISALAALGRSMQTQGTVPPGHVGVRVFLGRELRHRSGRLRVERPGWVFTFPGILKLRTRQRTHNTYEPGATSAQRPGNVVSIERAAAVFDLITKGAARGVEMALVVAAGTFDTM